MVVVEGCRERERAREGEAGGRLHAEGKGLARGNGVGEAICWGMCWGVRETALLLSRPRTTHRLVGLVVKAFSSRAEDPGFVSRWRRDFFRVESYQ